MISEQALYGQMRNSYPLLRNLLPGHGSLDIELVIREVATTARIHRCGSWQEAWNTATGATPTRPGWFRFYAQQRCPECRGKKWNFRLGGKPCLRCHARGSVYEQIRQQALFVPLPQAEGTPQ